MFSCRTRGFCPSCHTKRIEEWGEWRGNQHPKLCSKSIDVIWSF